MKFQNTQVWGFQHALRGMRNAKNSWHKADSYTSHTISDEGVTVSQYTIGPNDMQLAQRLIQSGSQHRKFMRQIMVSVDITAPLYFWKEFDTYKVGTVANSTSTMHTLQSSPITIDCFETDDYCPYVDGDDEWYVRDEVQSIIVFLESLRKKFVETKDKRYWKELIRWLPQSWLQKRTVTLNYENLLGICSVGQRRFHKLNEWSGKDCDKVPNFIEWARSLPYAQQFIFIDEKTGEKCCG